MGHQRLIDVQLLCAHFYTSKRPMRLYEGAEWLPCVNSQALVLIPGIGVGATNGSRGTQGSYFKLGWLQVLIKLVSEYVFPQNSVHQL